MQSLHSPQISPASTPPPTPYFLEEEIGNSRGETLNVREPSTRVRVWGKVQKFELRKSEKEEVVSRE